MKEYITVPMLFAALISIALYQPTVTPYEGIAEAGEYNLGNIRKTATTWTNEVPCTGAFKCFDTELHAIEAVEKLLSAYWKLYHLNTIEDIMFRYAPPVENDTLQVIRNVASFMGIDPTAEIDMTDPVQLSNLATGIIRAEGTL